MTESCCICDGEAFVPGMANYRRCTRCGHESLVGEPAQTFMLNETLDRSTVARDSALDRFQSSVLERCIALPKSAGMLVDIGSGAGKFLLSNRQRFSRAIGLEVTPEAVNFSKNTLGLHIERDIAAVSGEIDVATAWHSLEHFPPAALHALLAQLAQKFSAHGRVIVSVPNAAAFQARWFGERSAFYDVPNHLHQFTPQSLQQLFGRYGFAVTKQFTSWPYNVFGYIQGLLNLAGAEHNYLYYRLKRGRPRRSVAADALAVLLLPIAVPVGLMFSLLDAVVPARAGVLTWCFEKRA